MYKTLELFAKTADLSGWANDKELMSRIEQLQSLTDNGEKESEVAHRFDDLLYSQIEDEHPEFIRSVSAPEPETIIGYTAAPESYDGFGTKTIEVTPDTMSGKPVRKVAVEKANWNWQAERNRSGSYPLFTEEQFNKFKSESKFFVDQPKDSILNPGQPKSDFEKEHILFVKPTPDQPTEGMSQKKQEHNNFRKIYPEITWEEFWEIAENYHNWEYRMKNDENFKNLLLKYPKIVDYLRTEIVRLKKVIEDEKTEDMPLKKRLERMGIFNREIKNIERAIAFINGAEIDKALQQKPKIITTHPPITNVAKKLPPHIKYNEKEYKRALKLHSETLKGLHQRMDGAYEMAINDKGEAMRKVQLLIDQENEDFDKYTIGHLIDLIQKHLNGVEKLDIHNLDYIKLKYADVYNYFFSPENKEFEPATSGQPVVYFKDEGDNFTATFYKDSGKPVGDEFVRSGNTEVKTFTDRQEAQIFADEHGFKADFGDGLDIDEEENIIGSNVDKPVEQQTQKIMEIENEIHSPAKTTPVVERSRNARLFGDDFFKNNPDKILGVPYEASGRFGPVTKYDGTLDDLNKIELPEIQQAPAAIDTVLEISGEAEIKKRDPKPASEKTKKAIDSTKHQIIEKTKKNKKATLDFYDPPSKADTLSFNEVYDMLNKEISLEELQAFIYWKEKQGERLSPLWYNKAYGSLDVITLSEQEFVEKGHLYYFRGKLLPAFIYFAENIYERYTALNSDKEDIIETYGQSVYDNQLAKLTEVVNLQKQNWKTLDDPEVEKRLVIKPISELARTYKIKTLSDEKAFKEITHTQKGKTVLDYKGKLQSQYRREYQGTEIPEMTLVEAFRYWLKNYHNDIQFRKGTNWLEIIEYYLDKKARPGNKKGEPEKMSKTEYSRITARTKTEGDRLFGEFLAQIITTEDRRSIETKWNDMYNGYVKIDYYKVPVAFTCAKTWGPAPMEIKTEKREAVACTLVNRSMMLAYDVGVGKTPSAIFIISAFLDAGYCSRPVIIVPNQVYKQFKSEIALLAPHLKVYDLYNMNSTVLVQLTGKKGITTPVDERSIAIMTYEGFEKIGFNEKTRDRLVDNLFTILNQGGEDDAKKSKKQIASLKERIETITGRGASGTMINIEDLGFDFMCIDEAHSVKKVFTRVKGKDMGEGKKARVDYAIQSGTPSTIALKAFCISRYVSEHNSDGNLLLLTATPFTNSPLEIFSMLTLIGYKELRATNLDNINNFFDTYVQAEEKLIINSRLKPVRKQVFTGWNNLSALQQLIYRFINFKDVNTQDSRGNKIKLNRPAKWMFPLRNRVEGTDVIPIPLEDQVDSNLQMSPLQQELMANVTAYAEGNLEFSDLERMGKTADEIEQEEADITEEDKDTTEAESLEEGQLNEDEKLGVRILRSVNFARSIALNPYLYNYSGLGKPKNYKEFVEASPKMMFAMQCIASIRKHHLDHGEPISGIVIYMDRGKDYFPLIAEYIVKELGYKPHEVGYIRSGMPGGPNAKEDVKNKFLGLKYCADTDRFADIPYEERMKVLIGSGSIKEGMNLQRHSTTMFDLFLDWNPTDFIQVQGRVHRQGNLYKNIRIVVPLMEDSMDIFMFQKLQEKTARINAIWASNNQFNVLPVDEFNPEELKYQLITDPYILAELKIKDEEEKLEDEINGLNYEIKVANNMKDVIKNVENESVEERVRTVVNMFRGEKERSRDALINTYVDLLKTQKDGQGKPIVVNVDEWRLKLSYQYIRESKPPFNQIKKSTIGKIDDFDQWRSANIQLKKKMKDWFAPKGIKPDIASIDEYIKHIEGQGEELKEVKKHIESDENKERLAKEIIEEKARMKTERKTLEERVAEFAKYNYLLTDRKIEVLTCQSLEEMAASCPPTDKEGNRRIDADAIALLEKCNEELVNTKRLNTDAQTNEIYTDERKKLHINIIATFMKNALCMKNPNPIAIITGGAPGSGKSTFLKTFAPYLTSDKIFRIDQDELREFLPEYKGWNSMQTHDETRDIVRRILENVNEGKPCTFDILYDGTMNTGKNYIPLIEALKGKFGYDVYLIYLKIPYEVSLERTLQRYRRGKDRGRYVPRRVINEYFENEGKTFELLKPMVDGYITVDGETQEIIDKGGKHIPQDRNYLSGKPADLSKVLDGEVDFKTFDKPPVEIVSVEEKPKAEPTQAILEPEITIEVQPENKKEVLQKKIAVFKTLLAISKDKNQKLIIQQKLKTFNILLSLQK